MAYTVIAMFEISTLIDGLTPLFTSIMIGGPLGVTVLDRLVMGITCDMILYAEATTEGTTIVGRLLLLKFPKMEHRNVLIAMDGIIGVGTLGLRWEI